MQAGGASIIIGGGIFCGRRVPKTVGGVTAQYVYDVGGSVVAEWSGTPGGYNGWGKGYVYLGGQLLAQYDNSVSPATTFFVHKDHLGTTRLLTKLDQSVQETLDFLPFGEQLNSTSTTTHKFTGKERDTESNLDFFIARYYSSQLGRFLSPDEFTGGPVDAFSANDPLPPSPLPYADITNPQSLNKYTYTWNNPINFVDPNGHDVMNYELTPEGVKITSPFKRFPTVSELLGGLDAAGFAPPPVGPVADGVNVLVSLAKGDGAEAAINLAAMIPLGGDAMKAAKMTSKAFGTAVEGGKHAGFLVNYANRSVDEILKGINSLGKQIAKHEDKIANPSKYEKNWNKLSKEEQQGLINKWQKDIQRQKEQKEILEQLKKAKEA
jgi:RHS repeat-associated protein